MNEETKVEEREPGAQPGDYISRIFFMAARMQDVMGTLYRIKGAPEGEWHFDYRFRYYSGPNSDPFTGGDRKSWYGVKLEGVVSEAELVDSMRRLWAQIRDNWPDGRDKVEIFDELPIESDDQRVMVAQLRTKPWCHLKIEKKKS